MKIKPNLSNLGQKLHLDKDRLNALAEPLRKPAFYATAILLGSVEFIRGNIASAALSAQPPVQYGIQVTSPQLAQSGRILSNAGSLLQTHLQVVLNKTQATISTSIPGNETLTQAATKYNTVFGPLSHDALMSMIVLAIGGGMGTAAAYFGLFWRKH